VDKHDMRPINVVLGRLALAALLALAGWFAAQQMRHDAAPPPQGVPAPSAPDKQQQVPREILAFTAIRDGERITLSGSIRTDETRNALLDGLRQAVPNAVLSDGLNTDATIRPDLAEAAAFALRQLTQLPSARVDIRDRAIAIAGQAPDAEAYRALVAVTPPDGYRLDLAGLLPPVARPYTWSAALGERDIALRGHVPSEAARQDVLAAAGQALPDKRLIDQLQPASGLPDGIDFGEAARFALAHLSQLRVGTADLVDGTLSLRGDVTDKDTLAAVRAAVRSGLPAGLVAGTVAVTVRPPSPYAFSARREAGTLTLTGYYPDPAARAAIDSLTHNRFFSEQVVDRLRRADGAPKGYVAGVSFGLEHLARLASGEILVRDASVEMKGEALYEQTAEQTARAVRAMSLPGWTGTAEVRLRSSEAVSAEQ
jgi:OmpA-OmpF porin, OOP family